MRVQLLRPFDTLFVNVGIFQEDVNGRQSGSGYIGRRNWIGVVPQYFGQFPGLRLFCRPKPFLYAERENIGGATLAGFKDTTFVENNEI